MMCINTFYPLKFDVRATLQLKSKTQIRVNPPRDIDVNSGKVSFVNFRLKRNKN